MMNPQFPNGLPTHTLGVDDSFTFRCTQCGQCCRNREDILVSPFDLFRIAKHFDISPEEAFSRYCIGYIGSTSRMPVMILKARGVDKACPFLKNHRCVIQKSKPTVCAMFPLGRAACVGQKDGGDNDIPKGTIYFLQDIQCGAKDETHTVREWLSEFDLDANDGWFSVWQSAIMEMTPLVHMLEKIVPPKAMEAIFATLLHALYFDFQTAEPFLPRFSYNARQIVHALKGTLKYINQGG